MAFSSFSKFLMKKWNNKLDTLFVWLFGWFGCLGDWGN